MSVLPTLTLDTLPPCHPGTFAAGFDFSRKSIRIGRDGRGFPARLRELRRSSGGRGRHLSAVRPGAAGALDGYSGLWSFGSFCSRRYLPLDLALILPWTWIEELS